MRLYELPIVKDKIKKDFIDTILSSFFGKNTIPKIVLATKTELGKESCIDLICEVEGRIFPQIILYQKKLTEDTQATYWMPVVVNPEVSLENSKGKYKRYLTFSGKLEPGTYKVGDRIDLIESPYLGKSLESVIVK